MKPTAIIFFLLAMLVSAPPKAATARREPVAGQQEEAILRKHETVLLDPARVSEQVRRTGHLTLATSHRRLELSLTLHDLRSASYVAQEIGSDGQARLLENDNPIRTYRAVVTNLDNAGARLTIDAETVEGLIFTNEGLYFLEPARKFSKGENAKEFWIYEAAELIGASPLFCGLDQPHRITSDRSERARSNPKAFTPARVLELATEADFEYVSALGDSTRANNEILSVLNQIEGIYERDLGIRFDVVFQHTWLTPDDPYSTTVARTNLDQLRAYWNTNLVGVHRDLTHMWSGKTFDAGIGGIAAVGVVCSAPDRSYSVTKRFDFAPFNVGVPAHEIGHNFGATHPEEAAPPITECRNTLMDGSFTTSFSRAFCQFSQNEITNYFANNSGCLAAVSSVQFSAAQYVAREEDGCVRIVLTRGDSAGSGAVSYATEDATAAQGSDYQTSSGVISFAPGQTSATIAIALLDDAAIEADETFRIFLSSPSSALNLGNPASATITIRDDDPSPPLTLLTDTQGTLLLTLDSVNLLRDPFPLLTINNLSTDHRTRILLFVENLTLSACQPMPITVQAEDSQHLVHQLPVEFVTAVPGLEWLTQLNVRLSDDLPVGDLLVSVFTNGRRSNLGTLRIR
ncbi:MAG TPA: zinc-dependent metalloprotease family protein [Pyrinomonadaceae bacterium]|nr:zinc-dependent metalloprotease family protein [Pyrinomonadaceae bacterium]